ncbi:MAG TPA: hypothetical protein VMT20_29025 [Terriglobia bacterium]|nr:hypothetical protein [Terriglobia bacterium]
MTSAAGKAFRTCLFLLASTLLVVSAAAQDQPQHAHVAANLETTKGAFTKPETITGALAGVDPTKGLIIVARRGPNEPPTLQLSWSEKASSTPGQHGEMSSITASRVPGETDYDFRVTSATLIEVNGVRQPLTSLAALSNANTKVRFTPRRDGDFALEISVTH